MKNVLCLVVAFWIGGGTTAEAKLRFSGVLGQSQSTGAEPLVGVSMRGVASDAEDCIWSFSGDGELHGFVRKGESWALDHVVRPPSAIGVGELERFDDKLVYAGKDRGIYFFDPVNQTFAKQATLPEKTVAFTIDRTRKPCRYLALCRNKIMARPFGVDNDWTELFDVPLPRSGALRALAADPVSGNIMVGSSWSSCEIGFYDDAGHTTRHPVSFWAEHMTVIDGVVWGLHSGARTVSGAGGAPTRIHAPWLDMTTGLTRLSDGSWWLATSQGLREFDSRCQPTGHRIGGVTSPALLAVAPDGTLIACDSGRMLRWSVDDPPDAPLRCNWRERFRPGMNWRSHARCMRFDGRRFLVLDDVLKRVWAFDPWHTGWKDKTWEALTPKDAFTRPTSLAAGNGRLFVSDEEAGVLMRRHPGDGEFVSTGIEQGGLLAANLDDTFWVASGSQVRAYEIGETGAAVARWQRRFGDDKIRDIAAGQRVLAVVHGTCLSLCSVADGSLTETVVPDSVSGGMTPISVAVLEPWVLVGDVQGRRILRFRNVSVSSTD